MYICGRVSRAFRERNFRFLLIEFMEFNGGKKLYDFVFC